MVWRQIQHGIGVQPKKVYFQFWDRWEYWDNVSDKKDGKRSSSNNTESDTIFSPLIFLRNAGIWAIIFGRTIHQVLCYWYVKTRVNGSTKNDWKTNEHVDTVVREFNFSFPTDVKYAISSFWGTPLRDIVSLLPLISEPRFYCDFESPDQ